MRCGPGPARSSLTTSDDALVGQQFEAAIADRAGGGQQVTVVGRHCESGDVLGEGVPLRDPQVGDLLAIPVTGA